MARIKAILFDLDDTLIASGKAIISHHLKIAAILGLKQHTYDEVGRTIGIPWEGVLKKLWPDVDTEEFKKTYRANYKEHEIKLMPGAYSLLKNLKQNFILGLVTSRDKDSALRYAKDLKIYNYFNYFVTADHEFTKPDPRVFESTLTDLKAKGIKKEEVMFIGDSIVDFQSAKSANLNFTAVLTGMYSKEEFEKLGAKTINSIAELTFS